jgi:hypothetical protein
LTANGKWTLKLINCFSPANRLVTSWSRVFTKTINFTKRKDFAEIGERMKLQEIEDAFNRFKICPKCNSKEEVWLVRKPITTWRKWRWLTF